MHAAYLTFELRRTLRNPRAIVITTLVPVLMWVLFSSTSAGGVDPVAVKRHVLASMIAYGAIGGALMTTGPRLATERTSGWMRQLRATPLPASSAITAKLAVAIVVGGLSALVVGGVGLVAGAEIGVVRWLGLVGAMTACALSFGCLGVLVAASIRRAETAQGVTLLAYLGMSALGGLWVPTTQFPTWLADLATALPTYHVGHLGRSIVADQGVPLDSCAIILAWTIALGAAATVAWRHGTRVR